MFKTKWRCLGWALGLCLIAVIGYVLGTDAYTNAKFRTTQEVISQDANVDLTGLRALHASGGPAVHFHDLKKRLAPYTDQIVIVDGINAYHGYIGETPVIFYGYHRRKETDLRHLLRRLIFTGTFKMRKDLVVSEEEMAKHHGCGYKNISIHNSDPNHDQSVDDFVALVDSLPKEAWVHFHCRFGHGRTSMLLAMFDIMRNAPQVSLDDIVKRQHLLGSENLFDMTRWWYSTYSPEMLQTRKDFIEQFYAFITQRKAGGIQHWSEWRHRDE